MTKLSVKTIESKVNDVLSRYIYAVYKDIELNWNGEITHDSIMFQKYDNYILSKDDENKLDGLRNEFTISSESRQILTILFKNMIEEINGLDLKPEDDLAVVSEKLEETYALECYTLFMWNFGLTQRNKWGETLKNAADPTTWFHSQMVGLISTHSAHPLLMAVISSAFDNFLKAFAYMIGKYIWYHTQSVSQRMVMGMLNLSSLSQDMLDTLESKIRPKIVKKSKGKSPANKESNSDKTSESTESDKSAVIVDSTDKDDESKTPSGDNAEDDVDDLLDEL